MPNTPAPCSHGVARFWQTSFFLFLSWRLGCSSGQIHVLRRILTSQGFVGLSFWCERQTDTFFTPASPLGSTGDCCEATLCFATPFHPPVNVNLPSKGRTWSICSGALLVLGLNFAMVRDKNLDFAEVYIPRPWGNLAWLLASSFWRLCSWEDRKTHRPASQVSVKIQGALLKPYNIIPIM